MQTPSRFSLIVSWIGVFGIVLAAVWPFLSVDPIPFPGLRRLASGDPLLVLMQAAAVLAAGLFVTVRRWQTRDRWLIFRGIAMTLGILGFAFIGGPFGIVFMWFFHDAVRVTRLDTAMSS